MFYFEKKENISNRSKIIISFLSIIIGVIAGGLAICVVGINPLTVYGSLLSNSFGSWYAFSETLVSATPLLLITAGLILIFRMGIWNIGAYGQYIMGAICSSYFAIFMSNGLSMPIMLSLMFLGGLIGGALWALIPALLRVLWDVNEVISTLLLNYIALYILKFLMYGSWRNPTSYGFPLSKPFPDTAHLPIIFEHTRISLGFAFAVLSILVIWFIISKTKFGYEVKVIGDNPVAAKYAGINVDKDIIIGMMISGALAGLAGMVQVSGIIHFLQIKLNANYGYTAIIVAWVSYLNPFLSFVSSILFGGLESGGYSIQISMRVSYGIVGLIESIILFSVVGAQIFLNYKLRWKR